MMEWKERRRFGDPAIRGIERTNCEDRNERTERRGYKVRVVYTEPEFLLRNPHCPPEFAFSHRYPLASSPQDAVRQAMDYFDCCAEHSHVGWRRILKSLTVDRT